MAALLLLTIAARSPLREARPGAVAALPAAYAHALYQSMASCMGGISHVRFTSCASTG